MGKAKPKNKNIATGTTTAKAAKKAKAAQKVERKEKKKVNKNKDIGEDSDDEDLEGILDKLQREWEAAHTVTEELVEGPPSRRASATLTACPNGNHLWCIGGEFFAEDGRAHFYNDVFRYAPEKNEWRKFVSKTCPGPRSAHAVVASPIGGGKLFLFGGEFSSLHQTTFHHYRDLWSFDITTHSWDRIDVYDGKGKVKGKGMATPSARSGHRYLNDLWLFDTQEYRWMQVDLGVGVEPTPRSGFSFLSTPDGILLHGGYCKEYVKGKRPVGIMLDDTWFLRMTLDTTTTSVSTKPSNFTPMSSKDIPTTALPPGLTLKWERRKRPSTAYAPSLRSGCTMTAWPAKSTGVLFGGVTDEDTGEEGMDSIFWNDLNGYQWTGKGRWLSLILKRPKTKREKEKGGKKKVAIPLNIQSDENEDMDEDEDGETVTSDPNADAPLQILEVERDLNDPNLSIPLPRYNAMLAVLRNTLYIYSGIYERGSREYTLDDFYSLQLDKMDRYVCLKESGVIIGDDEGSSSDDEDDEDDEDDSEDEYEYEDQAYVEDAPHGTAEVDPESKEDDPELAVEEIQEEKEAIRSEATSFVGVAKDNTRSAEDVVSTPLPGETLAMFYTRSREYWAQKAHGLSDNRGKQLRRDGFGMAEERYAAYKPILDEVEKILAEAGLDEEEMRTGATGAHGGGAGIGQTRNRR